MPAFKGKDGTGWKDTSAIYGKDATGWLYGKEAFAKNDAGWQRVWTDCRLHDAGGRGWSDPVSVVTFSPDTDCGNRTQTTTVTRTKTGCPDDVRAVTVASPNCNSGCFDGSSALIYSGSCASRTYITRTTYTAKAGSNCTTYSVDSSPPISSPDCGAVASACWTDVTNSYVGQTVTWAGVSYTVYDMGSGFVLCTRTDETRPNCPDAIIESYTLWSCGSAQGVTFECVYF